MLSTYVFFMFSGFPPSFHMAEISEHLHPAVPVGTTDFCFATFEGTLIFENEEDGFSDKEIHLSRSRWFNIEELKHYVAFCFSTYEGKKEKIMEIAERNYDKVIALLPSDSYGFYFFDSNEEIAEKLKLNCSPIYHIAYHL